MKKLAIAPAPRRPAAHGKSFPAVSWRTCEFCGCKTNAVERVCCTAGRRTDRQTWGPRTD